MTDPTCSDCDHRSAETELCSQRFDPHSEAARASEEFLPYKHALPDTPACDLFALKEAPDG